MDIAQKSKRRTWEIYPYIIAVATLVALGLIIYTSGQRMLRVAEQMALEDAEVMHWWYQNHRETLNAQTAALAYRVSDTGDFESLAEALGLANHPGYLAWILPDQSVKAALNPAALVGDPLSRKMFAFVPAVGQPAADFWHDGGIPYFISMAPVPAEQGGGVILLQSPVDDALLNRLAELTGREVMFYSFEGQIPLASSNPALISDPPLLDATWMQEVATGQVPDSIRTENRQEGQVVGVTGFQDFGGITYSGYLALIESTTAITQLIPTVTFVVMALISLAVLVGGCVLVHRMVGQYLARFRNESRSQQRAFKLRLIGLIALFLLPAIGSSWYIIARTSQESRVFDQRATRIAKDVTFETFAKMTDRIEQFVSVTPLQAETPEAVANRVRLAGLFDFGLAEPAGELSYLGDDKFPEDGLALLSELEAGQVKAFTTSGIAVILAGKQLLPDGSAVIGGYRLDRRIKNISDDAPIDLTVLQGSQPVVTSLSDREIETLALTPAVEERLNQERQASYEQRIHWHDSKLAAYVLNVTNLEQWRLVVSQASVTWLNAIKAYQAVGVAIVVTLLVIVGGLMTMLLNQDHPLMLRRLVTGYLFIMPALIWLIWWRLGPALFTVFLSFHKWSVLDPAKPFVGWHNYNLIWGDDKFWNAMWNTLVYTTQIPISMILSLALAMALNQQIKGIRALRTIYYMPAVTSIVVVSLMWQLLYNKDLGVFNYLLSFVGLGPYGWLQSPTMAMPSIMGMSIWLALGAQMLLFLAGLQSIPNEYYEAAEVDGANGWYKFWRITLPLLAPTTFFVLVTSVIASFQVFGPIYVLTDGGPAGATDVAVYRIYFEAWQNLRFGYASAETVVLFAFLFIVTLLQFRYFGRRVSYG